MAWDDIDYMRSIVSKRYPGTAWKGRVRNMSDCQIIAIYCRFINEDNEKNNHVKPVHNHPNKADEKPVLENPFTSDSGVQLTLEGLF